MKKVIFIALSVLFVGCAGMKKAHEFYENESYELAIQECERAIAQDSLNAEAHYILGKSYLAQKNVDNAIASLTTAYVIQPASNITDQAKEKLITAKLLKGDELLADEDNRDAVAQYREVLNLDSTNFQAYFKLGNYYEGRAYLDRAKDYYSRSEKYSPDSSLVAQKIQAIDSLVKISDSNFSKGLNYYESGKNSSAVRYLKRALQQKQDHEQATYYFHMARGKIFYRKGSKTDCWNAIEQFGKAMIILPESPEPNYFMAKAYEKKDREEFDNAIEQYKKALEKDPDGAFARASKRKIRELTTRRDKLREFWGK